MNLEDSYANLLKDADKLKLMLLAWNYQNSAAVRNGTSGPDMTTMTNLWEQYQNALGISVVNNKSTENESPVSDLSPFELKRDKKCHQNICFLFSLHRTVRKMSIHHRITIKRKTKVQKMSLKRGWIKLLTTPRGLRRLTWVLINFHKLSLNQDFFLHQCSDVCATVCRWESWSHDSNLEAAERKSSSDNWFMCETVSRVFRACSQTITNIFKVVSKKQEDERWLGKSTVASNTRSLDIRSSRTNLVDCMREWKFKRKKNANRSRANQSVVEHSIVAFIGSSINAKFVHNGKIIDGFTYYAIIDLDKHRELQNVPYYINYYWLERKFDKVSFFVYISPSGRENFLSRLQKGWKCVLENSSFFCLFTHSSILGSTRSVALPTTSPYDFSNAFMQKSNSINPSSYFAYQPLGSTIAQGNSKVEIFSLWNFINWTFRTDWLISQTPTFATQLERNRSCCSQTTDYRISRSSCVFAAISWRTWAASFKPTTVKISQRKEIHLQKLITLLKVSWFLLITLKMHV